MKKVYLLNQDYLFGQSIRRRHKKYLAHTGPTSRSSAMKSSRWQVKDFSPYIAKIKASGAVAGDRNYGRDLELLIKAGNDSGLDVHYDSYLAISPVARPRPAAR